MNLLLVKLNHSLHDINLQPCLYTHTKAFFSAAALVVKATLTGVLNYMLVSKTEPSSP